MSSGDSPFLAIPASEVLAANRSAFVIADRFPVSPGHALVVPRRVIATVGGYCRGAGRHAGPSR
jgi:diadenosine tetraphosphate (Ap4A) HIT family hydrolase